MSPALTFIIGLVILVLFFLYIASDTSKQRRWVGLFLSLAVLGLSLESAYPPDKKINLGLDLQGGTSFLLRLAKLEGQTPDPATLEQAVEVIRKRIDKFGVSEPVITPEGNDRILVQIPGMDPEKILEAKTQLEKVAKLEMKLVHDQSAQLVPRILAGEIPPLPDWEIAQVVEENDKGEKVVREQLLVKRVPDILGSHVKGGRAYFAEKGWGVSLEMTSEGADIFAKITAEQARLKENSQNKTRLAILLDGVIQSAPSISQAIYGGHATITGNFSEKEARTLASVLENPLAVPIKIEAENSASSTLGAEAVRNGILAGVGGLLAVLLFIVVFYRIAGVIAVIALLANIVILIGAMAMFNFVLTLPGIAGIILTIGLAVDASVLIYERLREELATGKSLVAALDGAYSKAFSVIFDANVTTLIMAGILFYQATGPVKGFAITLTMGVIAAVFTAMVVGRTCFDWATKAGLKSVSMGHLLPPGLNINFLGKRRLGLTLSLLITIASIAAFVVRGEDNFGIDFKGGDHLVLSAKTKLSEEDARKALGAIGLEAASSVQSLQSKANDGTIREDLSIRSPLDTADKIEAHLKATFPDAGLERQGKESIGKTVGNELARRSLIALGLGLLGVLIFVSIRFEFAFAVGAIMALLHDVIVTVGLFSITGRELSLVMIGAILTVAGYSINDTIVVFDRIREGLKAGRKGSIVEIMNASINETLSRTLLTSGTTFLAVLSLYLFGGAVLHDFAFAIMMGILIGTYSSIFIAPPVALWLGSRAGRELGEELKEVPVTPSKEEQK